MNETLEAMARAIFKSWFVDFDPVRAKMSGELPESICRRLCLTSDLLDLFPDRFIDSEVGEVPEGWKIASIEDFAEVRSGKRPEERHNCWSDKAQVPLWGGNGPMGFVPRPLYSQPILLTGRVGTLGSVFRIYSPCWPSDNTLVLEPKNQGNYEFLFFRLCEIDFRSLNRGSTQPLLTQTDLKAQSCVLPSSYIMEFFRYVIRDKFSFIESAIQNSKLLETIRDTLLPKLLSGELSAPVVGEE
jgi:type I restriction enzyme S subunit